MNRDQLLESIIELSKKYREFSHSNTFTTDEQYVFSEVSEDLDRLQEHAADGDGEPAEQIAKCDNCGSIAEHHYCSDCNDSIPGD